MVFNFDGTFKNERMTYFYFIVPYFSYMTPRNAKRLLWISSSEIRRLEQAENTFHAKRDVLLLIVVRDVEMETCNCSLL